MNQRVWILTCSLNGFTFKILLRTLETKIFDYMHSELPRALVSYSGASEKEIEAAAFLKIPIYCY